MPVGSTIVDASAFLPKISIVKEKLLERPISLKGSDEFFAQTLLAALLSPSAARSCSHKLFSMWVGGLGVDVVGRSSSWKLQSHRQNYQL